MEQASLVTSLLPGLFLPENAFVASETKCRELIRKIGQARGVSHAWYPKCHRANDKWSVWSRRDKCLCRRQRQTESSRLPQDPYLRTDYRSGTFQASQPLVLCELNRPGTIVAHWLQYESEKSVRGEQLCEGDHQIFLDGDTEPTLNYLGSEDAYGFSWGFQHGVQWDGRCAIVKLENLKPSGSRVAALRCRVDDAIRFQKSCRWVLTYDNDPHAARNLGPLPIPYRHCVYYYAQD